MALPLLVPIIKFAASLGGWAAIDYGIGWLANRFTDTGEVVEEVAYEPNVFMILTMATVTFFVLHLLFRGRD